MYILRSKNVPGHRRASSQNLPFQKEIIALLKEVQIRERGYISASGFGPGGPNLLADMDRGVQIRGGSKSAVTPDQIGIWKYWFS